jgi:hypothetical protein
MKKSELIIKGNVDAAVESRIKSQIKATAAACRERIHARWQSRRFVFS